MAIMRRFDKLHLPVLPKRVGDSIRAGVDFTEAEDEINDLMEEEQIRFLESPEYKMWVESAARAARYLRQLAAMIQGQAAEVVPLVQQCAKRGEVDQIAAFRGLVKKTSLQDSYFVGLTPLQETCMRLKYEYGLSQRTIAKRVGKSSSTVQEHLRAGKARMQQMRSKKKI